ncbi:hypothetical protein COU54_03685 [Candidatus Pacearchaeota archaeon CG10_big_fil_rev_8_21_14_0_10_31_24]|nr:MAG: hypothetical protein COU54_03685 [Candidatus Pacearchaeota archaeon CG10_big_fil_rev_8_21_14_0_10_31_24]
MIEIIPLIAKQPNFTIFSAIIFVSTIIILIGINKIIPKKHKKGRKEEKLRRKVKKKKVEEIKENSSDKEILKFIRTSDVKTLTIKEIDSAVRKYFVEIYNLKKDFEYADIGYYFEAEELHRAAEFTRKMIEYEDNENLKKDAIALVLTMLNRLLEEKRENYTKHEKIKARIFWEKMTGWIKKINFLKNKEDDESSGIMREEQVEKDLPKLITPKNNSKEESEEKTVKKKTKFKPIIAEINNLEFIQSKIDARRSKKK